MSGFHFRPAESFKERHGLFVAMVGGTSSGKTWSALRLARGIAGPDGKIAVLDTEGGRTLHLKSHFAFDANVMDPPFRPARFAEAAKAAEDAGYDVMVIDSLSMEWVGLGGVLSWHDEELDRMAGQDYGKRERMKMAAWIRPKQAHKAMVYSFLQRKMPIIFSIRGEESVKPGEKPGDKPTKVFKTICNRDFPYELTVSFRLSSERRGTLDLSDPTSWKMEADHRDIFRDGDLLSEEHGAKLAAWARGEAVTTETPFVMVVGSARRFAPTIEAWAEGWQKLIASRQTKGELDSLRQLWDANRETFEAIRADHGASVAGVEGLLSTVLGEREAA